jgi:hypothetical protein
MDKILLLTGRYKKVDIEFLVLPTGSTNSEMAQLLAPANFTK